jgi:hypothetical protein
LSLTPDDEKLLCSELLQFEKRIVAELPKIQDHILKTMCVSMLELTQKKPGPQQTSVAVLINHFTDRLNNLEKRFDALEGNPEPFAGRRRWRLCSGRSRRPKPKQ